MLSFELEFLNVTTLIWQIKYKVFLFLLFFYDSHLPIQCQLRWRRLLHVPGCKLYLSRCYCHCTSLGHQDISQSWIDHVEWTANHRWEDRLSWGWIGEWPIENQVSKLYVASVCKLSNHRLMVWNRRHIVYQNVTSTNFLVLPFQHFHDHISIENDKNPNTPNFTLISSWWLEIWPHEYLISPIEITVNWHGS